MTRPGLRPEQRGGLAMISRSIGSAWPPDRWASTGVVVGISGGADSVALLIALTRLSQAVDLPGFLIAAHFDHRLRGDASARDAAFCRDLARSLGVRFEFGRAGTVHRDEAGLRAARLNFLAAVARRTGARYVALAHHRDDNVETALHQLLRGTGPAGLAGMSPFRDLGEDLVLARPMLNVAGADIRAALREAGQDWCDDETNQDHRYRRNWIRHKLIGLIESEFPHALPAIARLIESQSQWRRLVESLADDWLDAHVTGPAPFRIALDTASDAAVQVVALQRLWDRAGWPRAAMSQADWQRLAESLRGCGASRYQLPGNIDVRLDVEAVSIVAREVQSPFQLGGDLPT